MEEALNTHICVGDCAVQEVISMLIVFKALFKWHSVLKAVKKASL